MLKKIFLKNTTIKYSIISLFINFILFFMISNLLTLPNKEQKESYLELSLLNNIPPSIPKEQNQNKSQSTVKKSFFDKIIPSQTAPSNNTNYNNSQKDIHQDNIPATNNTTLPSNNKTTNSNNAQQSSSATQTDNVSSNSEQKNTDTLPLKITPPYVVYQVTPEYSNEARENGWEGEVLLQVFISANGVPDKVSIINSSGNKTLDRSALNAVKQWRFSPATNSNTGEKLSSQVTVPVVFTLN